MSDGENKALPPTPDPAPEPVGIGKPLAATNPPTERPARKGKGTVPAKRGRKRDLRKALSRAAVAFARQLKREFRTLHEADPKAFRAVVQKAQARIFRLKPGPKQDERIAQAGRERLGGAAWQTLYPKYIEFYAEMKSESTREYAESGFQKKVNGHLQRHRNPRLRRQLLRATAASKPTP